VAYDVPQKQLAPRIWLRLTGEAKQCVESMDVKELATEDGVDKLMRLLDKQFLKEEHDEIDKAVSVFWGCRRATGQSMESYLMTMKLAKKQMEREDPDTTIGDQAYAVRLLKRAGLSAQDKQAVLSATGARYDTDLIEKALRRLFPDVSLIDKRGLRREHGTGPRRFGGKSSGKGKGFKGVKFRSTYAAEEAEDSEESEEEAMIGEDAEDGEYYDEEDSEDHEAYLQEADEADDDDDDQDPLEEAMASFRTAKQKLGEAKKRQQRGYGKGRGKSRATSSGNKEDSLEEKKKKTKCSSCHQYGHWHGDPACPNVKSGKDSPYKPKPRVAGAHFAAGFPVDDKDDDKDKAKREKSRKREPRVSTLEC